MQVRSSRDPGGGRAVCGGKQAAGGGITPMSLPFLIINWLTASAATAAAPNDGDKL
jgi:hypothetical protein